jgi:hypothetical protein
MIRTIPESIIQKFPLVGGADRASVMMPQGAVLLYLGLEMGTPTVWAMCPYGSVDPAPEEVRHFRLVATGFTVPHPATYIGSLRMESEHGSHAFHFFEEHRYGSLGGDGERGGVASRHAGGCRA